MTSARHNRDVKSILDWPSVALRFHVLSATDLMGMDHMHRYQIIRHNIPWIEKDQSLVTLLFISHRWKTLEHPDPDDRQLRAIQQLLRLICSCVEAMLVPRKERISILPSIKGEGVLQAAEIARRTLGFGPFRDSMATIGGRPARRAIQERWSSKGGGNAFQAWLMDHIGVWLDYCCMPQKPHTGDEDQEFRRALSSLGDLAMSATVLSLRFDGDNYPCRGWCASEFFLGSSRSFTRGVYVDMDRLEVGEKVAMATPPNSSGSGNHVLLDAYEQDRQDFEHACRRWKELDPPLIEVTPPDSWSPYRWMWGNSSYQPDEDPNPFRLVLNAIMDLEKDLIRHWFMSPEPGLFDLAWEAAQCLKRHGLNCAAPEDLGYLGVLTASHGWVNELRPLFRQALSRYSSWRLGNEAWSCLVDLKPLDQKQQELFVQVRPHSPDVWHSRLTTGPGSGLNEQKIVTELKKSLQVSPPRFTLIEADSPPPGRSLKQLH